MLDIDGLVAAAIAAGKARSCPSHHDYLSPLEDHQRVPSGDTWHIWLFMAGRGTGKTFTGSRWLLAQATRTKGDYAVVGPTFGDVRTICVEGPSGIIAALTEAGEGFEYHKTKFQITLSNGSVIHMLSADNPDRIRGYNFSGVWCDEVGAWRYDSSWYDGIIPALRIGEHPRAMVTTTPRSTKLMRDLAGRTDGTVIMTRASTWDNAAHLSAAALAEYRRWEGTTRGRQELHGELLEDMPGAKWKRVWIDAHRAEPDEVPQLNRVVVGVDPSGNDGEGDECGIVVAGIDKHGIVWVLDDASTPGSPEKWARAVAHAFDKFEGDRVVAEKNFGGAMVASTLRNVRANLPVRMVNASRGKAVRAEPIAALYEQGRVRHVGAFVDLEDQMTQWEPTNSDSPDRMDALVWAVTELTGGAAGTAFLSAMRAEAEEAGVVIPSGPTDWLAQAAALHATRTGGPRERVFATD